jgi:hypothetical protein
MMKPEDFPRQVLAPPILKYAFSMWGSVRSLEIGVNPVGKLVDIDYVNLAVDSNNADGTRHSLPDVPDMNGEWEGIQGRVVAGSDWATFRKDGVIEFNGRLTLRTRERATTDQSNATAQMGAKATAKVEDEDEGEDLREDGLLINMLVSGVVDVLSANPPLLKNRMADIVTWDKKPNKPPLPLALGVRFELAQAAEPWLAKENPQRNFEKYAKLVQSPFLACGFAIFQPGEDLPSSVEVDILQVVPAAPWSGGMAR